jgi:hypothetical protein
MAVFWALPVLGWSLLGGLEPRSVQFASASSLVALVCALLAIAYRPSGKGE